MAEKKTPDASNPAEVAAIKEKSKSAAETFKEDMEWFMGNPRGRRIAARYLDKCHIFESSFSTNLSQTNFNEGERNIGLMMLNDIMENAEDKYLKMLQENKNKT